MRSRTSLPRSIRPRETPTSAQVCDAKERPCSRRRHGRRLRPAHLAKGHRRLRSDLDHLSPSPTTRPPLGSLDDLDLDRLERLDVASPDQGEEGPQPRSAGLALTDTLLPPRTAGARERLPPRRSRACGCDLPSGGGRVGPRDRRVAAGAAGRTDPEVLGVLLSTGTSLRANEAAPNNWIPSELPWSERLSA